MVDGHLGERKELIKNYHNHIGTKDKTTQVKDRVM